MSAMAMASSLNPNAPLFIPAAYRQVEDFSPEWWELVQTTAWFRDHWFRQHQRHEAELDAAAALGLPDDADVDLAALLPDDSLDLLDMVHADDLFYAPDHHHHVASKPVPPFGGDVDGVLRTLSLNSPRGAAAPRALREQPRYADKPAQHAGARAGGFARRAIHQPR